MSLERRSTTDCAHRRVELGCVVVLFLLEGCEYLNERLSDSLTCDGVVTVSGEVVL